VRPPPGPDRDATCIRAPRGAVVAVLIGVEGKAEGEVFKVRDGENRLGRAQTAEISIPRDDTVSRDHAVIIHREGSFAVKSLKKDNPTLVNGETVEDAASLFDGNRIQVGQCTFLFRTAEK
jgi:pSer/pThr/pTyr-binding forkhead associated (FHA) protein